MPLDPPTGHHSSDGPHISVIVPGWGENGVGLGVGQIVSFTEEDGFQYLNRSQEYELHVIR